MSYLGPLRLHFAGRFQAATSSVNNDPTHFDNSTFLPSFQELQGPKGDPPNGWFDPRGDADFRLIGCRVTAAFLADGSPAPADDLVRELLIADSDRAAPAKIVDLDPCQQMVSTIFGLEVRIIDAAGVARFRGTYEPAAFFDIWGRAPGQLSDTTACAYYQSVLTAVEWGDISSSPFLTALRDASPDRLLSIKFMVDGYNGTFGDAEFTRGRIVGTIGPGGAAEPRHLVQGRQFVLPADTANTVNVNFCVGVVDSATSRLYLDLGNALPTKDPGGDIDNRRIGKLSLCLGEDVEPLCPVPYQASGWYEQTAGIVALPADRPLTAAELKRMATTPMSLSCARQVTPVLVEAVAYVRPDQLAFRCDPGGSATVRLYATKLGRPHAGATIRLAQDSGGLQPPSQAAGTYQAYPASWTVGVPASAVSFPGTVTTDGDGIAVVTVATSDPGNPRIYIDGQVYGISATLADGGGIPADPQNFVSLLVWSGFQADDPPTWHGSLQPVFQQYANLYPIMQDFLDLSSYDDVCAHRKLLLLAFSLPVQDANSMPVTRDLSTAKKAAIMRWLSSPGADGKPLLGTAPPAKPAQARPASGGVTGPAAAGMQLLGGKGAAFRRMLSRKAKP
jgi:hypothetical protein